MTMIEESLAVTPRYAKAPPMAVTIMASAGSFAAISTLLGSPLLGAFLMRRALEYASGLGVLIAQHAVGLGP